MGIRTANAPGGGSPTLRALVGRTSSDDDSELGLATGETISSTQQYAELQYRYSVVCDTARFKVRVGQGAMAAAIGSTLELSGELEWRLLAAPRNAPNAKHVGCTAKESVTGTLDMHRGLLELQGHQSSDKRVIGTDSYRLSLTHDLAGVYVPVHCLPLYVTPFTPGFITAIQGQITVLKARR